MKNGRRRYFQNKKMGMTAYMKITVTVVLEE
jgi:hypothetical protein